MGGKKQNRPDAGFCLFGALALQKLTDDLLAEADGVRQSEDIEYIHRMRVASRRIRAALPLFAVCFPTGMDTRTRKGVRAITRSLGAARDLDVQIDFLNQYLDTLPPESPPVWHAKFLPPGEETTVLEHPPDSHFESAVTRPARPKSPGLLVRIRQMLAHIRSAITGDSLLLCRPRHHRLRSRCGRVSNASFSGGMRCGDGFIPMLSAQLIHSRSLELVRSFSAGAGSRLSRQNSGEPMSIPGIHMRQHTNRSAPGCLNSSHLNDMFLIEPGLLNTMRCGLLQNGCGIQWRSFVNSIRQT